MGYIPLDPNPQQQQQQQQQQQPATPAPPRQMDPSRVTSGESPAGGGSFSDKGAFGVAPGTFKEAPGTFGEAPGTFTDKGVFSEKPGTFSNRTPRRPGGGSTTNISVSGPNIDNSLGAPSPMRRPMQLGMVDPLQPTRPVQLSADLTTPGLATTESSNMRDRMRDYNIL